MLVAVALVSASCGTADDLAPDTVSLRLPDQRATLDVDGCGRDDDVVVLGASSSTVLVQILLRIDGDRVDEDASAVTVTLGARGTLGAGDASLIDAPAASGGRIRSASVRGDRIEIVADVEPLEPEATVRAGRLELSARCTAEGGLA